jgi:hypothetical protein
VKAVVCSRHYFPLPYARVRASRMVVANVLFKISGQVIAALAALAARILGLRTDVVQR